MSKTVILALVAGLLGGLASQYLVPLPVFAQNQAPVAREVRAERFVLLEPSGQPAGTFRVETARGVNPALRRPGGRNPAPTPGQTRIVLRNSEGREIWSAGGNGLIPLSAR